MVGRNRGLAGGGGASDQTTRNSARKVVAFEFPAHPREMLDNSPEHLSNDARNLRMGMIEMISEAFLIPRHQDPRAPNLREKQREYERNSFVHYHIESGDILGFMPDMRETFAKMAIDAGQGEQEPPIVPSIERESISGQGEAWMPLSLLDERAWTTVNVKHLI